VHAGYRGQDLSGRAIAALERILVDESLLHRVQIARVAAKSFDGHDGAALGHHREGRTRQNTLAVGMYGARTALAMAAAFLGSGQANMITQSVEQCRTRIDAEGVLLPIDGQGNGGQALMSGKPPGRGAAVDRFDTAANYGQ
jgi:hypothetical protein